MKGKGEIVLGNDEMKAALQYYFDKVMFRDDYKAIVTGVSEKKSGYGGDGFTVTVEEPPTNGQ